MLPLTGAMLGLLLTGGGIFTALRKRGQNVSASTLV